MPRENRCQERIDGIPLKYIIILFRVGTMFFSLFCNVFCTCLHYWYVKVYWENWLQREQTHVRTITLHAHDYILLVTMKWNHFTKPCYSDPAPPGLWWLTSFSCRSPFYFFIFSQLWKIDCGKAQSRSSMHSKPQQQPTLLFRHFVVIFFTFLNFWANLSRLWHTDHCN